MPGEEGGVATGAGEASLDTGTEESAADIEEKRGGEVRQALVEATKRK